MMAKVEGMPLDALEHGRAVELVDLRRVPRMRLEGKLGVNAGFLVGHCALRRKVMGAERGGRWPTTRKSPPCVALLAESITAGGLGFSSSQSRTHSDGDGNPITSRFADRREMLAFCAEVAAHEGTTLEYITNGCLDTFSAEEMDLMVAMTRDRRSDPSTGTSYGGCRLPEKMEHQLSVSSAAAKAGGRIVALTMPTLVPMNMSFRNHCALFLIPGWVDVLGLPVPERIEKLKDPAVRARLDDLAHSERGRGLPAPGGLGQLRHRRHLLGRRTKGSSRAKWARSPPSAAPNRSTRCWTSSSPTTCERCSGRSRRTGEESWVLRAKAWQDPRAMVGGSDAGAHLDRMCGTNYPTAFLGGLPAQPQARSRRAGGADDDGSSPPSSSGCAVAGR